MTAEQILEEIEKLDPGDRHSIALECGLYISDIRMLLRFHPDQEMVERACLHFLGDDAQEWYEEWKKKQEDEFGP